MVFILIVKAPPSGPIQYTKDLRTRIFYHIKINIVKIWFFKYYLYLLIICFFLEYFVPFFFYALLHWRKVKLKLNDSNGDPFSPLLIDDDDDDYWDFKLQVFLRSHNIWWCPNFAYKLWFLTNIQFNSNIIILFLRYVSSYAYNIIWHGVWIPLLFTTVNIKEIKV